MSGVFLAVLVAVGANASDDDKGREARKTEEEAAPGVTTALLDAMMERLAKEGNEEGLEHLSGGDLLNALAAFREAHEVDPRDPSITFNLGVVQHRLGDLERAETFYRLTLRLDPLRHRVWVNLADVLLAGEPDPVKLEALAEGLAQARREARGDVEVALRQARVAARRQKFTRAERLYRHALAKRAPDNAMRIELGDFYRDFEREEDAIRWYRQVPAEADLADAARDRIWRLEVDRQAKQFGWTRQSIEVPRRAKALAAKGRTLSKQGRHQDAEAVLSDAVRIAPHYSEARRLLGDVLRDVGRVDEAEVAYLRGLAFDQGSAELLARLGELYLDSEDASRAAEATVLLSRALQLRPDWLRLHLSLARAYRASGDLPRALASVQRYLAGATRGIDRSAAEDLEAALRRALDETATRPPKVSESASEAGGIRTRELLARLNRARAHLARGETNAAMAELRRIVAEERGAQVRNLEGRILHATGQLESASLAFRASLALDQNQGDVHEQLGIVLLALGRNEEAHQHLVRAERLGDLEALYHLSRLELHRIGVGFTVDLLHLPRLLEVRDRLARFLSSSTRSIYLNDALSLRREVSSRLRRLAAFLLLTILGLGFAAVMWRHWRWGGTDLRALLRRHPETGPEVQRVLSAIRHEVLKHNTMVLVGLVDAIDHGDEFADKAAHLKKSLFDAPGDDSVVRRFERYASELRQLGRAHGLRLNLRRKDSALSPIYRGFARLAKLAGWLDRLPEVSDRKRSNLLAALRRATTLLNTDAYEGLQRLLNEIRVLTVDEELLMALYRRTCGEPALSGTQIEPLVLDSTIDLPCGVVIPRSAFEDVLGNLFRNAIQSSKEHKVDPIPIGLGVSSEINAVTGHERILFAVRDCSPRPLSADTLLGQKIEGGLGLTAELVSKYDGSLTVDREQEGWAKAVVVKLPREDAPNDALAKEEV